MDFEGSQKWLAGEIRHWAPYLRVGTASNSSSRFVWQFPAPTAGQASCQAGYQLGEPNDFVRQVLPTSVPPQNSYQHRSTGTYADTVPNKRLLGTYAVRVGPTYSPLLGSLGYLPTYLGRYLEMRCGRRYLQCTSLINTE